MRPSMRAFGVAAVLVLLAVACGDDSDGGEAGGTTTTSTTSTADTAETTEPAEPIGPEVAEIDFGVLDLPPGDPYDSYTTVQDDTGVIEVQIPEDWAFLITMPVYPWGIDTGQVEDILASHLQATAQPPESEWAISDGDGSGASLLVGSAASEESALREFYKNIERYGAFDEEAACEEAGAFDYDDGTYTGQAELWTNCGSDAVAELLIGLTVGPAAGAEDWETDLKDHAGVRVRLLTDADIDAATRIIESLSFTPTTE